MATYKLRRFCQMDLLKRLDRENLLRFLAPFRDFFAEQNVTLPRPESRQRIDYEGLIGVLLSPAGHLPKDLVEALYFVDALSHPKGQEVLLGALPGLDYIAWDTPADIAVKAWMLDRDVVEQLQADGAAFCRSRSYESFLAPSNAPRSWATPTPAIVESIERELEAWFLSRKRGRGTRVFPACGMGDSVSSSVTAKPIAERARSRRGSPPALSIAPRNTMCWSSIPRSGKCGSTPAPRWTRPFTGHFRPSPARGRRAIQRAIQVHLGAPQSLWPSALACHDIPELAWAKLVEIEWGDDRNPREFIRYRCKDLLESFEADGRQIPFYAELLSAKFEIRLMHNRKPRKVTIVPPNTVRLTRDDDGLLVEQWLQQRGFINLERKDEWDEDSPLLESA
jgi:hypothetical protein